MEEEWARTAAQHRKGFALGGRRAARPLGGREARVGTGRVSLVNAAGRGDPQRMAPVFSVIRRRLASC